MHDNPSDRKVIGSILGDISTYEHDQKRPLFSSMVLRAGDSYEGDGFYKLAERLGFGNWQRLKREGVFEVQQFSECIKFWSDDKNFTRYRDIEV